MADLNPTNPGDEETDPGTPVPGDGNSVPVPNPGPDPSPDVPGDEPTK